MLTASCGLWSGCCSSNTGRRRSSIFRHGRIHGIELFTLNPGLSGIMELAGDSDRAWPVHAAGRLSASGEMAFAYFMSHVPRRPFSDLDGATRGDWRSSIALFLFLLCGAGVW